MGPRRRAEAQLRQTRRPSKPRAAMNPRGTASRRPGPPARPHSGLPAVAAFVRPRPPGRSCAHGLSRQPRGAPIVAPRRRSFTFRFLPPARGLSPAKPGSAGGRKLGGRSAPREDAHPRVPTPRKDETLNSSAHGPPPTPLIRALRRYASDPLQGAKRGDLTPNKEQRRRRALAAELPLPAASPHTRPPNTSDSKRTVEFQSYFRAPAGPTTP